MGAQIEFVGKVFFEALGVKSPPHAIFMNSSPSENAGWVVFSTLRLFRGRAVTAFAGDEFTRLAEEHKFPQSDISQLKSGLGELPCRTLVPNKSYKACSR